VVKVPWDGRERRSCTSDYWQIAFLYFQVRKNAQEPQAERRYRNGCIRPSDNISVNNWRQLLVTGKYGIEYSLASASDGPCLHGWGTTLKMDFPHLRFSSFRLTTASSHHGLALFWRYWRRHCWPQGRFGHFWRWPLGCTSGKGFLLVFCSDHSCKTHHSVLQARDILDMIMGWVDPWAGLGWVGFCKLDPRTCSGLGQTDRRTASFAYFCGGWA